MVTTEDRKLGLINGQHVLLRCLVRLGPLTNEELTAQVLRAGWSQSESGIVKRRSELKLRGMIVSEAIDNSAGGRPVVRWSATALGEQAIMAHDGTVGGQRITPPAIITEEATVGADTTTEGQTRLTYRGVRGDGDDRFAKSANGSVMVPAVVADAYRLFRKQEGWQHPADMHEVVSFVGGYRFGQHDVDPAAVEGLIVARLAALLAGHEVPYDSAATPEANVAALVEAIRQRTEAGFSTERAVRADPLVAIVAAAEVLDRRLREESDARLTAVLNAQEAEAEAGAKVAAAQELAQIAAEDAEAARAEAARYKDAAVQFEETRALLGKMLGYTNPA
jgi:hypothetical protein